MALFPVIWDPAQDHLYTRRRLWFRDYAVDVVRAALWEQAEEIRVFYQFDNAMIT